METGKTAKYLKYAIGEIVLVVIGILIALSINNWNEGRKNRQKETAIVKQIHLDFKSNKVQLDSIKLNIRTSIAGCDAIIKLMPFKQEKASLDSINKYFSQALRVKTFNPSNGSIDALINSSSFDVIQNDNLRNLLVSWKDVYKDYAEEEQYARDLVIWEILPFLRKNADLLNPYVEQNLNLISSVEFQNIWLDKKQSIVEVQNAIKDERIELYIDEILRLTKGHE